ncbi:Formyl-CoA transferase [Sphingobium chlorophenolicum L-1]|uniref:Formyl-CoA transferase n=1 Tax=Sphingobium chlorophenolicum L-1 TaxID=690566 RepID=F6F1U4_SPHCR|nr:CoA transferase [Sphingobium chlorophenolicum]AEG51510.1 Formyl-CoA transferase [Sphingobium chlorophenolicum L-1]
MIPPIAQPGALDGIRVVDMTSVLFGAYSSQILGDLGADVIKVEAPGTRPDNGGDIFRYTGKPANSPAMGPIFMHFNRNKRSALLDLKQETGREALRRLIAEADIFITNVRMNALQKLGFDYEAVKALKPDIVYVHCSGYGSDGPYAEKQAYDDLIQAAAGGTDLLSRVDGDPAPRYQPSLIADKSSGLFAAYATMAALFHRQRSGQGQFVEVPMFECFSYFNMSENLYGHTFDPPTGDYGYSRVFNPNRKPYATKDGHLAILPYTDSQWDDFFEIGGLPPGTFTKNPRYATYSLRTENIREIYAMIEEVAKTKTTAEWVAALTERNVPCMKVNRLDEVLQDEHLNAVGFFEKRDHASEGPYISLRHPVRFSETPASVRRDPPRVGEHTDEILSAIGLGEARDASA